MLALAPVQLLAEALDLGLGLEHRRLRELVRLVEVGLGGLAGLGLGLGLGECAARGLAPALGRRLERVRVAQHLAAHGGELRRGRVGLAGEPRELEVVGRDERALAGDALVDGVELDATAHGRLVRVVEGGCRGTDRRRECRRARPPRSSIMSRVTLGDGSAVARTARSSSAMRCRASESSERRWSCACSSAKLVDRAAVDVVARMRRLERS